MAAVPPDVLAALGRLNAHARGCRGPWNPSSAIYAYKTLAAHLAIDAGEAQVRFVRCTVKCGCDNGWFCYDCPDDRRRCRYCDGRGTRTLRFTETALSGGKETPFVWHHPWEGRSPPGYDLGHAFVSRGVVGRVDLWTDAIEWQDAGDWGPRLPPVTLLLGELAELLNKVEDWIDAAPASSALRWRWQHAKDCLAQHKHRRIIGPHSHAYQLDLGEVPGCCICGERGDTAGGWRYGCATPLFHWTLVACKTHGKTDHPQIVNRDLAPPDELIVGPLRPWLARHQRVVEVDP